MYGCDDENVCAGRCEASGAWSSQYVTATVSLIHSSSTVFEKTCATTQENVESHVFLDIQKKRRKTFKNVRIIFHGCLNLMFIVPLHCCQNLTLPNVPTRCSAMAQNGSHSRIWELNYSDH